MTTIQGTGGALAAPAGFNFKLDRFAVNFVVGESRTTGFGDGGWITAEPVSRIVAGQGSGVMVAATPVPTDIVDAVDDHFVGSKFEGTVVLTFKAGCTWTFTATIDVVDVGRAEDAAGSSLYAISFTSTGAVVPAWA